MSKQYSVETALNRAFPSPAPAPTPANYNTPRSGTEVTISQVKEAIPRGHMDMPHVHVCINGDVDKHDAIQLAGFFTALSARLSLT